MRSLLLFALASLVASPCAAQSWSIGQEREVDEGYYLKLLSTQNGWRIWQVDTKEGKSCRAIKSSAGRPHPNPVGVAAAFYGGTPFLTVYIGYQDKVSYGWQGAHLQGERVKFREPGARFWEEWKYDTDLAPWSGKKIELNIVTYEYPAIYEGRVEENAIFDLTGLDAAIAALRKCEGKG